MTISLTIPIEKILYRNISFEIQLSGPVSYDEDPTPIQRQIESTVTNGRGYLSLQEALESANQSELKLDLTDTINHGMVPIYFHESTHLPELSNPCGEISLEESLGDKINLPNLLFRQYRLPTLLEELKTLQFIKHD